MTTTEPAVIVIFGASGDLTARKLVPALYEMRQAGLLPDGACILGVSRSPKSDDEWRTELEPWVREHATGFDESAWRAFAPLVHYHAADATKVDDYAGICQRIADLEREHGSCPHRAARDTPGNVPAGNVLFFLSVAPTLYEPIIGALGAAGMVTEGKRWCSLDRSARSWQRVIVEKPFGEDTESAASLNRALGRAFEEESIYRIDHYLGQGRSCRVCSRFASRTRCSNPSGTSSTCTTCRSAQPRPSASGSARTSTTRPVRSAT